MPTDHGDQPCPLVETVLGVPDDWDAMSEAEQDVVLDGMIDQLVVEQGLEIS